MTEENQDVGADAGSVKAPRKKRTTTYARDDGAEMVETEPHCFVNKAVLAKVSPARKATAQEAE